MCLFTLLKSAQEDKANKANLQKLHMLYKPSVSFKAMRKSIKPCSAVIIPHL